MLQLLLLFLAGVVQDSLHGNYVAAVSAGRRLKAAGLSGAITLLAYTLFWEILEREAGWAGLAALAAGNFVGTFTSVGGKTVSPAE